MSQKINELNEKIAELQERLTVVENEQARGEIASRLDEVESLLAAFQKGNSGEI